VPIPAFLVCLGVASAAVALWFDVRFPNAGPQELWTGFLHVMASMFIAHIFVPKAFAVTGDGMAGALLAVFGVGFPALVYLFLVGFWVIRLAQRSLSGYLGR
jgi:hypothetical protein